MSSPSRRVMITGIGVLNPVGLGAEAFWENLQAGANGIRPIQAFDASKLPCRLGGEIDEFNAKNYITDKQGRKSLRVMARGIQLAVSAAELALQDANVDTHRLDPTRFGIEFGAGLMPTELPELAYAALASTNNEPGHVDLAKWGEEGLSNIPPLWMLKYLPNMPACHISIMHNAQGPNNTITESDLASLLALGEAYRILQRDDADFFLVGGCDSKMNPLSMVRQCLFSDLTKRNDEPETAMRPFDLNRDGYVIGEGATVYVVEELEHARQRGATIYAEILGFAAGFDRKKTGAGLARVLRNSLAEAKLEPAQLDHYNAHGMSTKNTDAWEARGYREMFGSADIPVFAAKSYFGNTGAASAITELAASLLGLRHGTRLATRNYQTPDPECSVPVTQSNKPTNQAHVVKLGLTEMGQCASVVCGKWENDH